MAHDTHTHNREIYLDQGNKLIALVFAEWQTHIYMDLHDITATSVANKLSFIRSTSSIVFSSFLVLSASLVWFALASVRSLVCFL